MKAIILIVCAGVALVQVAISLLARYAERPAWMSPTRATASVATAVTVAALAIVAVAAGGPGEVSDAFEKFKSREGAVPSEGSRGEQILDVSSSGRYDFWQSAIDANKTEPLTGIGPGTFEFWWSREGSYPGFVRDAHSLYFETLAELGWVGLILVGGFVLGVLGIGVARAMPRSRRPAPRPCGRRRRLHGLCRNRAGGLGLGARSHPGGLPGACRDRYRGRPRSHTAELPGFGALALRPPSRNGRARRGGARRDLDPSRQRRGRG